MYFSGMLKGDWPRGVDARPLARPEEDAASASLDSGGTDAGQTESSPLVSKKVQGKRAVADEPARKKRKTASAAPFKPDDISFGDDQTTWTWNAAVSEWSDDDEVPVAPPLSTKEPPHNMCVDV